MSVLNTGGVPLFMYLGIGKDQFGLIGWSLYKPLHCMAICDLFIKLTGLWNGCLIESCFFLKNCQSVFVFIFSTTTC